MEAERTGVIRERAGAGVCDACNTRRCGGGLGKGERSSHAGGRSRPGARAGKDSMGEKTDRGGCNARACSPPLFVYVANPRRCHETKRWGCTSNCRRGQQEAACLACLFTIFLRAFRVVMNMKSTTRQSRDGSKQEGYPRKETANVRCNRTPRALPLSRGLSYPNLWSQMCAFSS